MTRRAWCGGRLVLTTAWLLLFSSRAGGYKFEFAYVVGGGGGASSGTVSVINTATNRVIATIPVGISPSAIAVTPAGAFAYVANSGGIPGDNCTPGTVYVIDTAANAVIATVPVDRSPIGVAITPDGASAYVANACSNTISVMSTATNTVTTTLDTSNPNAVAPSRVAITPDGAFAYVTNHISSTVTVINTATNTVATHIAVGGCPWGIAMTPDGAVGFHE